MDKTKLIRLLILVGIILIGAFLWTHELSSLFQAGIGVILLLVTGLWLISLFIKDASIIDIFWGPGFVITAWFYASQIGFEAMGPRNWILLSLITLWGLRLGAYLAIRNLPKGEDYRYKRWRDNNGKKWWWLSFIRVFALQGFLVWIISAVYLPALSVSGELAVLDYVGIGLWAVGFFFEAVGDWQMRQFKKNRENDEEVMNKGLWRYTRHPNYFGDATLWWGYFCFGLAYAGGFAFIFCPIVMTFFLLKISGAAMLESDLKKSKPKYEEYIKNTSAFIPMPPKS